MVKKQSLVFGFDFLHDFEIQMLIMRSRSDEFELV